VVHSRPAARLSNQMFVRGIVSHCMKIPFQSVAHWSL
jgi:hypothetical protein